MFELNALIEIAYLGVKF